MISRVIFAETGNLSWIICNFPYLSVFIISPYVSLQRSIKCVNLAMFIKGMAVRSIPVCSRTMKALVFSSRRMWPRNIIWSLCWNMLSFKKALRMQPFPSSRKILLFMAYSYVLDFGSLQIFLIISSCFLLKKSGINEFIDSFFNLSHCMLSNPNTFALTLKNLPNVSSSAEIYT